MSYQETLDFLFQQLPMFQRIGGAAFKKDLTNIRKLCADLGQPQEQFSSIHIAGTNGKGSVAHLLSAVLQAHGYKTGLYTSPHYRDFRERIKVDGEYVPEDFVVQFVEQNKASWQEIQPSFFEITVAMAFAYFAEQKVDFAVIETGLGGRLDSTNIVTPLLSVITNISFDHQEFLGDTLPEIAGEKAGIIKQGIPVVIGERQLETEPVFLAKAQAEQAPISFAEDHFSLDEISTSPSHTLFNVWHENTLLYENLSVHLSGTYQRKNVRTALQALTQLPDFQLEEARLRYGLQHLRRLTNFLGRWEVIGQQPTILCDSAHNEAGMRLAMEQLQQLEYNQLHIVLGVVKDKDRSKFFPLLPKDATYYFAKADIPRGLDGKVLAAEAREYGLHGKAYNSVVVALQSARQQAQPEDLIYVGGSIFVVAEVV